ncbi:MAG: ThiF family adenylyltransferase [Patescibacteria group bacterium]
MDNLISHLKEKAESVNNPSYEPPIFFDLQNVDDEKKLSVLIDEKKDIKIIDSYSDQIKELIAVNRPSLLKNPKNIQEVFEKTNKDSRDGVWVYFPWRNTIVHILKEADYQKLRVSRNYNLITRAEQKKFAAAKIAVAGLNVGNPGAICIALEGGARKLMKLADNDILSVSNLNRYRAGLSDLGANKAVISAQQVHETDPYMGVEVFSRGINPENLDQFLIKPRIDLLIEEMDSLPLKIAIRESARKHRIPTIMVTGNGAGLILDVERFDQKKDLPLLNKYLSERVIAMVRGGNLAKLGFEEKVLLARDFMGKKYLTKRLQTSFIEIGKTLASIPQLAEASYLRGSVLAYVARQIIVGGKMSSGRYIIQVGDSLKKI